MLFSRTEEERHACYKCGEELVFEVKVARLDTCPNCSAWLHSCRNCRFWSPSAHNQCVENQGEFIRDREAGNFCGHFSFRVVGEDVAAAEVSDAKAKLDALFGGGAANSGPTAAGPRSAEDEARAKLDDLFKK